MKKYRISISTAIILFAAGLIVTVGVLVILISKNRYETALHGMSDSIVMKSADNIRENVTVSLASAVRISALLNIMFTEHSNISAHKEEFIRMMTTIIGNKSGIYSLYYGDEAGNFFLVGKRKNTENEQQFFIKEITHTTEGSRKSYEMWLDEEGNIVSKKDITEFDKYVPKLRPWYIKAEQAGKPQWSDPYIFFVTGEPGITYAVPNIVNGRMMGVCGVDMEIKSISMMKLSSFTSNTSFFLIDDMQRVLAYSKMKHAGNKLLEVSDLNDPVVVEMIKKYADNQVNISSFDIESESKKYKCVMRESNIAGLNLLVGIYTPFDDYLSVIYEGNKQIFFLSLLVMIISIFISVRISKALANPFIVIGNAVNSISTYDFQKQINIQTRFPEAIVLAENFNHMVTSLKSYKMQNEALNKDLETAYLDTLYRLAMAAEFKDHYTYEHLDRVSNLSVFIAEVLGMGRNDIHLLKHASAMHDVGKIGIPDNILIKPGKLTPEEFDIIKQHTLFGGEILKNPSSEIMEMARIVALTHHEKWNGEGYPNNVSGEDIPMFGRIVAIADVIDALVSKRVYKDAFSMEKTIEIITMEKGSQFQPELVELVLENRVKIETIIFHKK